MIIPALEDYVENYIKNKGLKERLEFAIRIKKDPIDELAKYLKEVNGDSTSLGNLTYADIAEVFGVNATTIKRNVSILKERLKNEENNDVVIGEIESLQERYGWSSSKEVIKLIENAAIGTKDYFADNPSIDKMPNQEEFAHILEIARFEVSKYYIDIMLRLEQMVIQNTVDFVLRARILNAIHFKIREKRNQLVRRNRSDGLLSLIGDFYEGARVEYNGEEGLRIGTILRIRPSKIKGEVTKAFDVKFDDSNSGAYKVERMHSSEALWNLNLLSDELQIGGSIRIEVLSGDGVFYERLKPGFIN